MATKVDQAFEDEMLVRAALIFHVDNGKGWCESCSQGFNFGRPISFPCRIYDLAMVATRAMEK